MSQTVYESIGDYSAKDCRLADHIRLMVRMGHSIPWSDLDKSYKREWLSVTRRMIEKYETLYYGEEE